jgi:hypothetical protein
MPTLQYVQPTDEQKQTMQTFRDKMEILRQEISAIVPQSRGTALALTKLEESSMWLNKALTNND